MVQSWRFLVQSDRESLYQITVEDFIVTYKPYIKSLPAPCLEMTYIVHCSIIQVFSHYNSSTKEK